MMVKVDSLKKKLTMLSLIPIIVMSAMVIGVLVFNNNIISQHKEILDHLYFYRNLSASFKELDSNFSVILPTNYDLEQIEEKLLVLDDLTKSLDPYIKAALGSSSWSRIKGLSNMMITYRQHTSKVYELLEQNSSYYEVFRYARTVSEFILTRIDTLLSEYVRESSGLYDRIQKSSDTLRVLLINTFIFFLFGLLLFVMRFGHRISQPIRNLSEKALRMANGEMNLPEEVVTSNDEIATLATSFNEMVKRIRLLIQKIVEQSELEKRLKEEEMRNLNNINFIREAEIKSLKSQINPHFLFNTLNTISKMALLEDAPTTNSLIQSTSVLLRYNLKNEKMEVIRLHDEIENVREYMKIYQIRFHDKFSYTIKAPSLYLDLEVPFLMLQPLVENAIIHGIEPKDGKSTLTIHVYKRTVHNEQFVAVDIVDDGVGMSKTEIKAVMAGEKVGLGINNVKKRVEYFYGRDDIFSIHSVNSGGTRVQILLPCNSQARAQRSRKKDSVMTAPTESSPRNRDSIVRLPIAGN